MKRLLLVAFVCLALGLPGHASDQCFKSGFCDSSGAGSVPGLTASGTGNDATYAHVTGQATFEGVGSFERHFWFSAYDPEASDANVGTYSQPMRTLGKAWEVCFLPLTRCTLKADGSVWSPLTIGVASTDTLAGFALGDQITWEATAGLSCPGTETGEIVGIHHGWRKLSIRRTSLAETSPTTSDSLCSQDDATSVAVASVTNTANAPGGQIVELEGCTDRDEACMWIDGELGASRPMIDFDRRPLSPTGALFTADDDDANEGGWLALSGFDVLYLEEDVFTTNGAAGRGGLISMLDVDCLGFNDASSFTNNCIQTAGNGFVQGFGTKQTMIGANSGPSDVGVSLIGSGGGVFLEHEILALQSIGYTNTAAVEIEGADIAFVGGKYHSQFMDGVTDANGASAMTVSMGALFAKPDPTSLQIVKSQLVAGSGAQNRSGMNYQIGANATATEPHTLDFCDTILSGKRNFLLPLSGNASQTAAITGRALVLDDSSMAGGGGFWDVGEVVAGRVTIDLEGSYDPDDVGTLCITDDSTGSDTQAGCQAIFEAANPANKFFVANSVDSQSGARADGVPWSRDDYVETTGSMTVEDADPDTITCAACDFVADGWTAGMRLYSTAGTNNKNRRTVRVAAVATTVLTLDPRDDLAAVASAASHTLREYTLPHVVHPEHNSYHASSGTCVVDLTKRREMEIPKFVTKARNNIRRLELAY